MRMSSDESQSENSEPEESPKKKDEDKNGECNKSEKLSDRDQKQCTLERCLPRVNCQEYIVFVLDLCEEEDSTPFQLSDGTSYSFLALVKKVLSLFIQNKSAISPGHKYALMVLHESPLWVVDFTTNPRDIINEIEALKEKSSSPSCDLSQIFDLIKSHVTLPPADNQHIAVAPPQYVIRMIFLYGRSLCLPQFLSGKDSFSTLVENPHFFLDVLYVHEVPKDENKCEGIFDLLCDLDETGWSYIFEVGRNPTKLHNLCSKLLAHPLQRPCQNDTRYTLLLKD